MNTILEFLNNAQTFYLATSNGEQSDVRPMGVAVNYEDKIYFITMKEMNLHSQLKNNSKVSISAKFETRWVRLYADAVLDDSVDTRNGLSNLTEQITKTFPLETMAPYYLKNVTASINSFTEEPKSYNF